MAEPLARIIPWVLPALLLSGCSGDDAGGAEPSMPTNPTSSTDASSGEIDAFEDSEPLEFTLYLTSDRKLVEEIPTAGFVTQGEFFTDYAQGKVNVGDFVWLSDGLPTPIMVLARPVTLNLWFESDAPIPPPPGATAVGGGGFFGSSLGMPVFAWKDAPPGPFMPGTPTQFEVTVDNGPPRAPIVIPQGETFSVFGGLNSFTTDQTPVRILVGGEQASSVTFTYVVLGRDPLGNATEPQSESSTGTFQTTNDPPQSLSFTVRPNASFVQVNLRLKGGHASDLDVFLANEDGDDVSASNSPATTERIHLAGPALDDLRGTDVSVRVHQFNAAAANYEVVFEQG